MFTFNPFAKILKNPAEVPVGGPALRKLNVQNLDGKLNGHDLGSEEFTLPGVENAPILEFSKEVPVDEKYADQRNNFKAEFEKLMPLGFTAGSDKATVAAEFERVFNLIHGSDLNVQNTDELEIWKAMRKEFSDKANLPDKLKKSFEMVMDMVMADAGGSEEVAEKVPVIEDKIEESPAVEKVEEEKVEEIPQEIEVEEQPLTPSPFAESGEDEIVSAPVNVAEVPIVADVKVEEMVKKPVEAKVVDFTEEVERIVNAPVEEIPENKENSDVQIGIKIRTLVDRGRGAYEVYRKEVDGLLANHKFNNHKVEVEKFSTEADDILKEWEKLRERFDVGNEKSPELLESLENLKKSLESSLNAISKWEIPAKPAERSTKEGGISSLDRATDLVGRIREARVEKARAGDKRIGYIKIKEINTKYISDKNKKLLQEYIDGANEKIKEAKREFSVSQKKVEKKKDGIKDVQPETAPVVENEVKEIQQEKSNEIIVQQFRKAAEMVNVLSIREFETKYGTFSEKDSNMDFDIKKELLNVASELENHHEDSFSKEHAEQFRERFVLLSDAVEKMLNTENTKEMVVVDGKAYFVNAGSENVAGGVIENAAAAKEQIKSAELPKEIMKAFEDYAENVWNGYAERLSSNGGEKGFLDQFSTVEKKMQFLKLLVDPLLAEKVGEKSAILSEKYEFSAEQQGKLIDNILNTLVTNKTK
jgi:hypothetical protein